MSLIGLADLHQIGAIALNPDYARAHHGLGVVLGLQRRYEEADEAFRQAMAITSTNLGLVLRAQGRYDTKSGLEIS